MKLISADLQDLHELYIAQLKKTLDMENHIVKALPTMVEKSTDPELAAAFQNHLAESETHVQRVTDILKGHTGEASTETCKVISALVTEAQDGIKDAGNTVVRDITLIAAGQQVEHHEIAVYGTLLAWADLMGYEEDIELLGATLEEEKAADVLLSDISDAVNVEGEAVAV
jgi:ferritin-like metal-binding protein YciE